MPPVLAAIRERDPDLFDQLRRAAQNALLQCAEAQRRQGRDRANRFRTACGEADEAIAALDIAAAWGYCDSVAEPRAHLDRALGCMWPMTR